MSEGGEASRAAGGPCPCEPCRARAQKARIRFWHWTAGLDLSKPPAPFLRWALLVILGLTCWLAGLPFHIRDWLGPIVIAGALILPDVSGFAVGGFSLDLKKTRDELAVLRQEVNAQARASSMSVIVVGDKAQEAARDLMPAVIEATRDQATGPVKRWQPQDGSAELAQSTEPARGT